jgi:hypothetical protein
MSPGHIATLSRNKMSRRDWVHLVVLVDIIDPQ